MGDQDLLIAASFQAQRFAPRADRPPDRAVVLCHGSACVCLHRAGPDLDAYQGDEDCVGAGDAAEIAVGRAAECLGLLDGVWVVEVALDAPGDRPEHVRLGAHRLATRDEILALREEPWVWDPELWYAFEPVG